MQRADIEPVALAGSFQVHVQREKESQTNKQTRQQYEKPSKKEFCCCCCSCMQISVWEPATTTTATCSKMQNNEKLPAFICNELRRRLWHALALPTLLLVLLLQHKYEYSFCNFCIRCGFPGCQSCSN